MLPLLLISAIALLILSSAHASFAAPYLPGKDETLQSWSRNFATMVGGEPARYGLTPADAAVIQSATNTYEAALTRARRPATRTRPAVAAKDAAKSAYIATVRRYAIAIRDHRGVSNADKLALGLNLINPSRARLPKPDSNPVLAVITATPGQHTIRYADVNSPASRSKPRGVAAMQLFLRIGQGPSRDPGAAKYYASVTRQPFAVRFKSTDNGKTATYFARWITRTGLTGPWSPPVSAVIVA